MIKQLPVPEENETGSPRAELDDALSVPEWKIPGERSTRVEGEDIPPGAPSWWKGEAEATDSFMQAMGIKVDPNTGEVVKR